MERPELATLLTYSKRLLARALEASTATVQLLVAGCVGHAAAHEFLTWVSHQDLPDGE